MSSRITYSRPSKFSRQKLMSQKGFGYREAEPRHAIYGLGITDESFYLPCCSPSEYQPYIQQISTRFWALLYSFLQHTHWRVFRIFHRACTLPEGPFGFVYLFWAGISTWKLGGLNSTIGISNFTSYVDIADYESPKA